MLKNYEQQFLVDWLTILLNLMEQRQYSALKNELTLAIKNLKGDYREGK